MTYHERVQVLAEKMAGADPEMRYAYSQYKIRGKVKSYYERWYRLSIGKKMGDARIAVAEIAEVVADVLSITTDYKEESLKAELKFRALIPDDGQEAKQDE